MDYSSSGGDHFDVSHGLSSYPSPSDYLRAIQGFDVSNSPYAHLQDHQERPRNRNSKKDRKRFEEDFPNLLEYANNWPIIEFMKQKSWINDQYPDGFRQLFCNHNDILHIPTHNQDEFIRYINGLRIQALTDEEARGIKPMESREHKSAFTQILRAYLQKNELVPDEWIEDLQKKWERILKKRLNGEALSLQFPQATVEHTSTTVQPNTWFLQSPYLLRSTASHGVGSNNDFQVMGNRFENLGPWLHNGSINTFGSITPHCESHVNQVHPQVHGSMAFTGAEPGMGNFPMPDHSTYLHDYMPQPATWNAAPLPNFMNHGSSSYPHDSAGSNSSFGVPMENDFTVQWKEHHHHG